MKRLLLLILLACLPTASALAQSSEAPPYFDIELLLFERTNPSAGASESWSNRAEIPYAANALAIQNERDPSYRLLPENMQQLSPDAYSLERSGRFKVLTHLLWRQPGLARETVRPIQISSGGLEGTLTISLSRYLHADFDMLLSRFSPASGEYLSFPFREHRRMRSGELHYIDHPLLGALIRIDRYEPPTAESAETTSPMITESEDTAATPPQSVPAGQVSE